MMHIIRHASLRATPWKNGGGVTREIIRIPASGEIYDWRLSLAHIAADGPFSDFSGYARSMVLLKGEGFRLKLPREHQHVLDCMGDLFEFDGALAVSSELIGGPCHDLNLIAAHALGPVHARVRELAQPLDIPQSSRQTTLVFCISGSAEVESARSERGVLETWDTLIHAPLADLTCRTAAASAAPAMIFTASIGAPDS